MNKSSFSFLALFIAISVSLTSCSSVNKVAVDSSSSLFLQFSDSIKEQDNVELLKQAFASNLLSMESLLSVSNENKNLLVALTKSYTTYAFLINETEMMEEGFVNLKVEKAKKQAMINYSKAIRYGLKYLSQYEISYSELLGKLNESQGIYLLLDKKLKNQKINQEVVMFTAQSLMALSYLKKEEAQSSSQILLAKAMFDWSCLKNPSIEYGTCDVFHALNLLQKKEATIDEIKHGNNIFQQAIVHHPHNWFIRMIYIQNYLIPQKDEEGFKAQMNQLAVWGDEYASAQVFSGEKDIRSLDWMMESRLRLYQAMAIKRYEILKQYKSQLF